MDGSIRVWGTDGSGLEAVLRGPGKGHLSEAPDGRRILGAYMDGTLREWSLEDSDGEAVVRTTKRPCTPYRSARTAAWSPPARTTGWFGSGRDAAFGPDGRSVLTGATDGRVLMWSSDGTGEPVLVAQHRELVAGLSFSPDGKRVLSSARRARITDLEGTEEPLTLHGEYWVSDAELSPDGEWVALGSETGDVRVFPVRTDAPPVSLRGGETEFSHVAFSPDGGRILAGAWDGSAWIWRLDGAEEPIELRGQTARVMGVAFSPDGKRVATSSLDGTVGIWRVTWAELLDYLRANLHACLTPEQRMNHLAESERAARAESAACERRLSRPADTMER